MAKLLKQMLLNEIEKDKSLSCKYAQIAGYANSNGFYKFLNEESREMSNFNDLLNLVRYSFMDREKEIMSEYIMTLDPNAKMARVALEYAVSNRMHDLAHYLIDKLLRSNNAESKEWAALYDLDRKVENGLIDQLESVDLLDSMRVKTREGFVFSKLIKIYNYQEKRLYETMFETVEGLEESIKKITDEYMRYSYLCRLSIVMVNVNLHKNRIEEARRWAMLVLDNTANDSLRYLAYLNLGNSYIFEDAEKALDYFNQSRLICKGLQNNRYKMAEVERSINFTCNYWNFEPKYLNFESNDISDIHEIAFYYIRKNDKRGLEILESINVEELNASKKGFHFFYRGLATQDKKYFYQSIKQFNLAGQKYYKQISVIELEKIGTEDYMLDVLAN